MTTLDLDNSEMMALLLLLKLGMDTYTGGSDMGEQTLDVIDGLAGVPNAVIDRLIAKVSLAGGHAAKGAA